MKEPPTRRNKTTSSFQEALDLDAVEEGILPLCKALHARGFEPLFSCQGHWADRHGYTTPYVAFWSPPALQAKAEAVFSSATQGGQLQFAWMLDSKPSQPEQRVSSRFNGQPGMYYHLYCPYANWTGRGAKARPKEAEAVVRADLAVLLEGLHEG